LATAKIGTGINGTNGKLGKMAH